MYVIVLTYKSGRRCYLKRVCLNRVTRTYKVLGVSVKERATIFQLSGYAYYAANNAKRDNKVKKTYVIPC